MQSIIAASLYGILSIIGGIIGYKTAGSKVSLISGTISGLLLLIAAYLQLQGQVWGSTLAVIITSILVIVFAVRLTKTRKFMPAGLMVILGLVALFSMLSQLLFSV
ncbi:small integral membrane protein [Rivularia sp. PCC 7116]|uniref:TMEM14 family protein n=1 Tax=Rivularia sp. PCC 7116 TaxID=373994 RepID=UPI00029F0229|nr:TMEM14 family protein [Rivularia sp. PCC 7116]AFY52680.1 small integral membrane protein [Rivularia sp. PCC 7116]